MSPVLPSKANSDVTESSLLLKNSKRKNGQAIKKILNKEVAKKLSELKALKEEHSKELEDLDERFREILNDISTNNSRVFELLDQVYEDTLEQIEKALIQSVYQVRERFQKMDSEISNQQKQLLSILGFNNSSIKLLDEERQLVIHYLTQIQEKQLNLINEKQDETRKYYFFLKEAYKQHFRDKRQLYQEHSRQVEEFFHNHLSQCTKKSPDYIDTEELFKIFHKEQQKELEEDLKIKEKKRKQFFKIIDKLNCCQHEIQIYEFLRDQQIEMIEVLFEFSIDDSLMKQYLKEYQDQQNQNNSNIQQLNKDLKDQKLEKINKYFNKRIEKNEAKVAKLENKIQLLEMDQIL